MINFSSLRRDWKLGYPARAFSLKVFLDLQPCDVDAPSFRDVQCSGYNNWVFPEDGKLHQWSEYKLPEGNWLVNYSSYLAIKSGKWEPVINLEISKLVEALCLWNIYIYITSLKLICVNLELCLFNFQIFLLTKNLSIKNSEFFDCSY